MDPVAEVGRLRAGQRWTHLNPARDALLAGRWDPIQELLDNGGKIDATAAKLGYV